MNIYKPLIYQKDIFSINYDKLKKDNIKYLVFDLDNTIGLINEKVCNDKVRVFLNKLGNDFKIIIASNNNKKRVKLFCEKIKADIISFALKPSGKVYQYLKKKHTKNMHEVAIIGDQIVTDIITGNRFGMTTILIDPLGQNDLKITNFNRYLEKKIMKKINFVKGEYYEKS